MSRVRGASRLEGLLVDWSIDQPAGVPRLPVGLLSKRQKAAELQRLQRRKAMDAAYEAELVLGLAEDTPDRLDPPPGTPGARAGGWAAPNELPGVSQFFTAELSVLLNCGRGTASVLVPGVDLPGEPASDVGGAARRGDRRTPCPRTGRRPAAHRPDDRPGRGGTTAG